MSSRHYSVALSSLFFLLLFDLSLCSQTWHEDTQNHRSIRNTDSNLVVITSLYNRILRSDDGGQTFRLLKTDKANILLNDTYFIDSLVGITCGADGAVFRTTDAGHSWHEVAIDSRVHLSRIYFTSPEKGYIIGDSAAFFATADSGKTWKSLSLPREQALHAITANRDGRIFVGTRFGYVLYSDDEGITWEETQPLLSIKHLASYNNTVVALSSGTSQAISVSHDNGSTWDFRPIEGQFIINDIHVLDSLHYIGLARMSKGYRVLRTTDGGVNWSFDPLDEGDPLRSEVIVEGGIAILTPTKMIACGARGLILHLDDTAEPPRWNTRHSAQALKSPRLAHPGIVRLPNGDIFGCVNRSRILFRSRDGGITWNDTTLFEGDYTSFGLRFASFSFFNDSLAYFSSERRWPPRSHWQKTTDGGRTFENLPADTLINYSRIFARDSLFAVNSGWLFGGGLSSWEQASTLIQVTEDAGETWRTYDFAPLFTERFDYTKNGDFIVTTYDTTLGEFRFFFSEDEGRSFEEVQIPDEIRIEYEMEFFDAKHGILAYRDGLDTHARVLISRTNDGGKTWHRHIRLDEGTRSVGLSVFDDSTAFFSIFSDSTAGGESGSPSIRNNIVLMTQDKGATWHKVWPTESNPHIPNTYINNITRLDDSTVMAMRYDGAPVALSFSILYANINDLREVAVSVGEEVEQRRGNPYLYLTVHPNPVRATARITLYGLYSVPPGRRSLKVYDLLGNQVADISDQIQNLTGGFATTEWNTAGIARGQYLVVFSDGNDARTRNVIVIE